MIKDDITDFEEVWNLFDQQQMTEIPEAVRKNIRGIFMSGGYAALGVLANRMSKLPGTVDPGDMVKALNEAIHTAFAELELKANEGFPNKTYGSG